MKRFMAALLSFLPLVSFTSTATGVSAGNSTFRQAPMGFDHVLVRDLRSVQPSP
jgi:hypothetical protein